MVRVITGGDLKFLHLKRKEKEEACLFLTLVLVLVDRSRGGGRGGRAEGFFKGISIEVEEEGTLGLI